MVEMFLMAPGNPLLYQLSSSNSTSPSNEANTTWYSICHHLKERNIGQFSEYFFPANCLVLWPPAQPCSFFQNRSDAILVSSGLFLHNWKLPRFLPHRVGQLDCHGWCQSRFGGEGRSSDWWRSCREAPARSITHLTTKAWTVALHT